MESIERFVVDIAADDRKVLERLLGFKLQLKQRIIMQVKAADNSQQNGDDSLCCEPSTLPKDWDAYSEMIREEAVKANAELDAILFDWARSSNVSDKEVKQVRSLLLEHSHLLDFDI